MQITTFNPFISTSHSDETVMLFEQLGFMRRHKKEGIEIADRDDTVIRMKDASGFSSMSWSRKATFLVTWLGSA